jgi:hypothetical protein
MVAARDCGTLTQIKGGLATRHVRLLLRPPVIY